jgi:hypothetical protein
LKGNLVRAVASAAAAHSIPLYQVEEGEIERGEREHFNGFQHRGLNADEVAEALSSQDVPMPDDVVWKKELHDKSADACAKLDTLEKEIIKRIFIQEQQIMDIAATLGYSRCHISRVKKKALETLHAELKSGLTHDDLGGRAIAVEEDDRELERRVADRRIVHRRRPRSKSAGRPAVEIAAQAA